jgi:hypothetical protein
MKKCCIKKPSVGGEVPFPRCADKISNSAKVSFGLFYIILFII